MNYEYYYEYFMYAFMYAFLREMKQMKAFRVYTPFYIKKKDTYCTIHNIQAESVLSKSIHLLHQQIQSIHDSIHKVFMLSFIFGG